MRIISLLFFWVLVPVLNGLAQTNISGIVSDRLALPLSGVQIQVEETNLGVITDKEGFYSIDLPQNGTYRIVFSFLGLQTRIREVTATGVPLQIDLILLPDPLELESIIVTGTFNDDTKLSSSIAAATLSEREIIQSQALGTAELLSAVPGMYADASAGPVFSRVYTRGVSALAEDDIGWYYVSLQEDGLPVTNYQTTYYGPDLFHRADLTTHRLEAVRGGSAAIAASNSPGGIFNFISKTGGRDFKGNMQLTAAIQGENNPLLRYDLSMGGPLANNRWSYQVGGFYRHDEGARNTDMTWSRGGQFKGNLTQTVSNGYLKIYAKYLNDHVNRYQGLAAIDWDDPKAAFGQNFNYTALNLPKLQTNITDGRNPSETYHYDTNDGIHTKDAALGLDFSRVINGWSFQGNVKVSKKSADWQSSISNQPLGLESFFPYLLSGIDPTFQNIPLGQVVFRDATTRELVARVNNFGILGPFQGQPASFEYLEGSLPNDALLGIAPWKKLDEATELMEQFSVRKKWGNHSLSAGVYAAYSDVKTFTSASFAYATYENEPRNLVVSLENPDEPIVQLSDEAGIANYGGLLFNQGAAELSQVAFFINDNITIQDKLKLDIGLRYDATRHEGSKKRAAPDFATGGVDGNLNTAYDNAVLLASEQDDLFDYQYDYLSWSAGLNYLWKEKNAFFARVSNGHKAPELNYYFNNFNGVPINQKGTIQDIFQAEAGIKTVQQNVSLFATLFYSQLDNVPFSEFVLNQETGGIFFTPIQLNKTTTTGLELEGVITLATEWNILLRGTWQDATATRFTVYNANETLEEADDEVLDYTDNDLPNNPDLMLEVRPTYNGKKWNSFLSARYMGKQAGNVANSFELPAFLMFNAGLEYQINDQWQLGLTANNLLNSAGLMNFFGPNEFGSNSNAATEAYINQNPDATFVVFPVSPRAVFLRIGYQF